MFLPHLTKSVHSAYGVNRVATILREVCIKVSKVSKNKLIKVQHVQFKK